MSPGYFVVSESKEITIGLSEGLGSHICTHMFIAALFAVARRWRQPRCLSVDQWMGKMRCIHTEEYYSTLRRREVLSHAEPWGRCAKWNEPATEDKHCVIPLHELSRAVNSERQRVEWWVWGTGEEWGGYRGLLLSRCRVSALQSEKVSETCCTTVLILLTPLN